MSSSPRYSPLCTSIMTRSMIAGVFQAVLVAGGDVGGFVGGDEDFLVTIDHACHAADDDPVFAAMVVHLQAEAAAGLDLDTLDLEARAFLEHGVGAPRAGDGAVQLVGVVILLLELGNDLLDVLRLVRVGNQQGIRRTDDHQVVEAHGGDQPVLALDEGILAVDEDGFADRAVVVGIGRDQTR